MIYLLDATAYLVRGKGQDIPFAIVAAVDRENLFRLVDENTDPYQCEVTALHENEGLFWNEHEPSVTEALEGREANWGPLVNDDLARIFRRAENARNLARLENETADLMKIYIGLKRKTNDRLSRHGRRSRKNASAVEETRPRQDHPHRGAGSHRVRKDRAGHVKG